MTERQWLVQNTTEEEWRRCGSMTAMPHNLDYCFGRCGVLFAAACCRTVWHLLPDEPGRAAVLAAERYAGGDATREELEAAEQRAYEAGEAMFGAMPGLAWKASPAWHAMWAAASFTGAMSGRRPLSGASYHARHAVAWQTVPAPERRAERDEMIRSEAVRQWGFVRDIFGSPHRPVALDAVCLTPAVVSLARAAWEHRVAPDATRPGWLVLDPERLLALAAALADAGCDDADCLGHLRGPGTHIRGCHVLDLLLGKG
ncbi:MAG TPA: hypothetical protein VHF26_11640 [Trebonia sp.]|nr:hypothetical protein [Trebonia sp.]